MKTREEKEIRVADGICLLIILFCLVTLLCACRTKYIPVEVRTTERINVHDTIVRADLIPYRDSVTTTKDSSFLSNPYGYSWAVVEKGKLHHSLGIWPGAFVAYRLIWMEKIRTVEKPVPYEAVKEVEVEKKLNGWLKFTIFLGHLFVGGIGIYVTRGIIRRKRKG